MKIKNKNITLDTNEKGEVISIEWKGKETLHDGVEVWQKIYPVIWPVIAESKSFAHNGINYKLPRHGFWKEMSWERIFENGGITFLTTHMANDIYPFSIDIQHFIELENDSVIIKTIFSNLSKKPAYFFFGHHPAFKIDDSSYIRTNMNNPQLIKVSGVLDEKTTESKKIINDMNFGVEYDTLVYKKYDDKIELINSDYSIEVASNDFQSLQIWKPKSAPFICIEPWQGWNDTEYDAPKEIENKINIVELPGNSTKEFKIKISYKNINNS